MPTDMNPSGSSGRAAGGLRIFLSYRRDDTAGYAGRLYDVLTSRFSSLNVFMDVDTIQPGSDFVETMEDAVASSQVMIALIGPRWLETTDLQGRHRLDDPNDFVRLEIRAAVRAGVRIVPVLVQGARMPAPEDLPEDLAPLARRNAIELSDGRWRFDTERLLVVLARVEADVSGAAEPPPLAVRISALPVLERKVVTILFCDLVGFTRASEDADPEDVWARLGRYNTMLRHEIETYGGTVEKFIGDAVMAVFGAPVAHEDDPERAVRAALRILDAIGDLNRDDPSLDLSVRIGVNTGEALVTLSARTERGESLVTGDVVNTASRLQGAAPVGAAVVGEGTFQATERLFDYQVLDPVTVKGKTNPVPWWLVRSARSGPGADLTRTLTVPLVGRDLERNLLTGTFDRGVRDASVQLVTIVGEPGVGKSRLVAELFAVAEARADPIRWRQGRCLPYGEGVTFWALGEMVKAEAGILETDPPEVAASKIDAAVSETHPDAPWLRQRLRPLVGLEAPPAAREENFAAWRSYMESLAEDRSTVFVFEDLHWADDALLAFVEHLVGYAEGVPMLLVATARPELFERVPTWASAARNATRINLAPLNDDETGELLANLLDRTVLPAGVQHALLFRAGGNPLYAEELVRLLKARGTLHLEGATWSLDPDAEIPLPSGVQGIIAARLDTLAADRKSLLADAAVIGQVFWSGAVAAMGERDPARVAGALHELSRKELVRPARRSSMEGESEYSFWHALVRDVCYGQIPRASRADRHRRAAAWIEEVAGERVEDHAEILAAHYSTALDLATATKGGETAEILANAVRYLTLAGDRALGMDVEAAERRYARALELTPEGHPQRPAVLARHAEALRQRGRHPEAVRDYEAAIDGFRAQGEVRDMALALGRYSIALMRMGDPTYRRYTGEALALLEPLGPSAELVQALAEQAGTSFVAGEYRDAIALADRAIGVASALGLPEPPRARGFRGAARFWLGDAEGLEDLRQALDQANAQGLGREVSVLQNNLAAALWPIEGPQACLQVLREGAAFAERRGIEEFVMVFAFNSLDALVHLGSYEEAFPLSEELVSRLQEAGDVFDLLEVRAAQMRLLTREGRVGEASPLADWAVEKAREFADPQTVAQVLPAAAAVRLGTADPGGAVALLAELDRTEHARDSQNYAWNLAESVRTALAAGDPDLAARLPLGVEPIYPLYEHALLGVRALLREHRGEYAGASEDFAQTAESWGRFEVPWERAQALLGRGRCLLALGRAAQAADALRTAREAFSSLGATPALAETDGWLDRAIRLTS